VRGPGVLHQGQWRGGGEEGGAEEEEECSEDVGEARGVGREVEGRGSRSGCGVPERWLGAVLGQVDVRKTARRRTRGERGGVRTLAPGELGETTEDDKEGEERRT
jgi:hypothetical protein